MVQLDTDVTYVSFSDSDSHVQLSMDLGCGTS
jgi:hypothetical protein